MGLDWRGSNHNNRAKKTNEDDFFRFPPYVGKNTFAPISNIKDQKNS